MQARMQPSGSGPVRCTSTWPTLDCSLLTLLPSPNLQDVSDREGRKDMDEEETSFVADGHLILSSGVLLFTLNLSENHGSKVVRVWYLKVSFFTLVDPSMKRWSRTQNRDSILECLRDRCVVGAAATQPYVRCTSICMLRACTGTSVHPGRSTVMDGHYYLNPFIAGSIRSEEDPRLKRQRSRVGNFPDQTHLWVLLERVLLSSPSTPAPEQKTKTLWMELARMLDGCRRLADIVHRSTVVQVPELYLSLLHTPVRYIE